MNVLTLPSRLDLTEARGLTAALLDRAGQDLTLDGEGVDHLGGLCAEVLVRGAARWRADGRALRIEPRSPAFDAALDTFGINLSQLLSEEAA